MRLALERSDLDTIVMRDKGGLAGFRYIPPERLKLDPKGKFVNVVERYPIDAMPNPHLELKTWSNSAFYNGSYGGQYEASGPFELRLVDGDANQLLAVWYRRSIRMPFWLPILTSDGWYATANSGDRIDRVKAGRQFLNSALGEVPLVPRPTPPAQPSPASAKPLPAVAQAPTLRADQRPDAPR